MLNADHFSLTFHTNDYHFMQTSYEKSLISNEIISLAKADFGVDVQVFSESDSGVYDPKGKARHARPFKPAILIE